MCATHTVSIQNLEEGVARVTARFIICKPTSHAVQFANIHNPKTRFKVNLHPPHTFHGCTFRVAVGTDGCCVPEGAGFDGRDDVAIHIYVHG